MATCQAGTHCFVASPRHLAGRHVIHTQHAPSQRPSTRSGQSKAARHSANPARRGQKPGPEGHHKMMTTHAQVHAHMLCSPDTHTSHMACNHTANISDLEIDSCTQPYRECIATSKEQVAGPHVHLRCGVCVVPRCTVRQARPHSTVLPLSSTQAELMPHWVCTSCRFPAATLVPQVLEPFGMHRRKERRTAGSSALSC